MRLKKKKMSRSDKSLLYVNFMESMIVKVIYLFIPLYILHVTEDAMDLAIARTMEFIPNIFLTIVLGYIVDRCKNKIKVLIYSVFFQTISLSLLVACVYYELGVFYIYLFLFSFTVFMYLFFNAHIVLTKIYVESENILRINSNYSLISTMCAVISPFLITYFMSTNLIFELIFVCLVTSFILLTNCLYMSSYMLNKSYKEKFDVNIIENTINAVKIILNEKSLLHLTLLTMAINGYEVMAYTNHFFYLNNIVGLGEEKLPLMLLSFSLGSVVAAKYGDSLFSRLDLSTVILISIFTSSACYIMFPITDSVVGMIILLFVEGFMTCVNGIYIWSHRQRVVEAGVLGSVSAITSSVYKFLMPFSLLFGGYIAQRYDSEKVYYLASIFSLITGFLYLYLILKDNRDETIETS